MDRFIIILLLLFISPNIKAQNLVPNASFEFNTSCPSTYAQIGNINSWFNPINHTGSADYFHICATNSGVSIPQNYWGYETPANGNAYIGLILYSYVTPNYREYVEVKLKSPLKSGVIYNVSFKYSPADNSNYFSEDFGIYFSSTPITGANNYDPINVSPQITISDTLNNTNGWTIITQSYTAAGGEQYMIVGNFLSDASTTSVYNGTAGDVYESYLYLDDFIVSVDPCQVYLGKDTTFCNGDSITLDATKSNATYLWQDSSTNPTFTVNQQGTYWVQITDSCGITSDTINVNYNPLPIADLGNDTTVCLGKKLTLDATESNASHLWQDNSTNQILTVKQQGTYWVDVTVDNCTTSDTIIIDFEDCSCILYVPNSFTPNFDSNNDQFSPILDCDFKEYSFVIFNRWGEKIFETNDYNGSWNGFYQGKLCPAGVYVYLVRYKYDISYEQEYGTVTLLK